MNLTLQAENFTAQPSTPGMFSYIYQLPSPGLLAHRLTVANVSPPKGPVVLNVTGVLPGTIDLGLSLRSTHIQAYGDLARQALLPAIALSSNKSGVSVYSGPSHLLFIPVLRANSSAAQAAATGNISWYAPPLLSKGLANGSGFVVDPGLTLKLSLTPSPSGSVETFNGFWSSSNSSYVLTFKCPTLGRYDGRLDLVHPPAGQGSLSTNTSLGANVSAFNNTNMNLMSPQVVTILSFISIYIICAKWML